MGKANQLGHYPVHFHFAGIMKDRASVMGCAIHRTFNRAITNHQTHKLNVSHNVAYNIQGMAYFFEDGAETGAIYTGNLAVLIRPSFSLLQKDMQPAGFWITHPSNDFFSNHAVNANIGFWFDVFGPKSAEMGLFVNNTAHNNRKFGVWGTDMKKAGTFLRTKTWANGEGIDFGKIWGGGVQGVVIKEHMSISDARAGASITFGRGKIIDAVIMARSSLPTRAACGIHGPNIDTVSANGTHFYGVFRKGFHCGCRWCPKSAGGVTFPFTRTTFHDRRAQKISTKHQWDTMLDDTDGTLTGMPQCHLHGCYVHKPANIFPPQHCERARIGHVCTKNIGLRVWRFWTTQPYQLKTLKICNAHGCVKSKGYMYNERGAHTEGMHHLTIATGENYQFGPEKEIVQGKIVSLQADEDVLFSMRTTTNPSTFRFQKQETSLNMMSLLGCPKECQSLSSLKGKACINYVNNATKTCHSKARHGMINCGKGCLLPPVGKQPFRLVRMGVECKSPDSLLGKFTTLSQCANACLKRRGCQFFIFGHLDTKKMFKCYMEHTVSGCADEGFDSDNFDFYALKPELTNATAKQIADNKAVDTVAHAKQDDNITAIRERQKQGYFKGDWNTLWGVSFKDLIGKFWGSNSNGIWQYKPAKTASRHSSTLLTDRASFNERFEPGLFTGIIKGSGHMSWERITRQITSIAWMQKMQSTIPMD
jgi:hypothetical protein